MIDARLVHVVAVAREGSFTAAAQSVGVTQSAITKSIADLERRTGCMLFHRTARGAVPTEEGRDFVQRAARMLADAHELLDGPYGGKDPYAGLLSVVICPASLEWLTVEPLAALLLRYPSVHVDVMGATFERAVQLLRSGSVDVAVGYDAAFGDWPDVARVDLTTLPAQLFVRKQHPLLGCAEVTERDIANYDFVSPSESRPYGSIFRNIYQHRGVDWQTRIHTVDYFPLACRIVAQSDAIGVVAASYSSTRRFQEKFEVLASFDQQDEALLCCATRTRWKPKPAVQAFIELMQSGLAGGDGHNPR